MIRFDPSENVATTDADLIVNTVNTVGVMGAGVAKAVKERFPEVMGPYQEKCRTRDLYPGGVQALRVPNGPVIVNLASPIVGLTAEQVRSIYVGETTNWADVQ